MGKQKGSRLARISVGYPALLNTISWDRTVKTAPLVRHLVRQDSHDGCGVNATRNDWTVFFFFRTSSSRWQYPALTDSTILTCYYGQLRVEPLAIRSVPYYVHLEWTSISTLSFHNAGLFPWTVAMSRRALANAAQSRDYEKLLPHWIGVLREAKLVPRLQSARHDIPNGLLTD